MGVCHRADARQSFVSVMYRLAVVLEEDREYNLSGGSSREVLRERTLNFRTDHFKAITAIREHRASKSV